MDLVNLRVKGYERIGEPEEDAFLRDLTFNAMFYNINEGKIEDYVGGMKDLQEKVTRTPIPAVETFTDDPCRLLRCIRFANKFDCIICEEIQEAAKNNEIREALANVIAPERKGTELDKILGGNQPHIAV